MDSLMLRDEAARERLRQAEEFLDPRPWHSHLMAPRGQLKTVIADLLIHQMMQMSAVTGPTSY